MIRIVNEKRPHLALFIPEIGQITGNRNAFGDQFVGDPIEVDDDKGEVANSDLVQLNRLPSNGIARVGGEHQEGAGNARGVKVDISHGTGGVRGVVHRS